MTKPFLMLGRKVCKSTIQIQYSMKQKTFVINVHATKYKLVVYNNSQKYLM